MPDVNMRQASLSCPMRSNEPAIEAGGKSNALWTNIQVLLAMASFKENLPPSPRGARLGQIPVPANIRPLRPLSPSDKPALHRQRDHSACRRPDTPLRVRKTRENLKKDGGLGDVPPPCVGCTGKEEEAANPPLAEIQINTTYPLRPNRSGAPNSLRSLSPEPLLSPQGAALPAPEQPRISRHRSVSKRVLSSLKSAASRTRSTHAIRPMESEASLLRRISGRRKPAVEVQPERRAYSFDVSRDSVASEVEAPSGETDDPAQHSVRNRLEHRSFTESTVSTTALIQELEEITPPFGTPTPERVVLKHRFSSAPESPPPRHPARFDITPRHSERGQQHLFAKTIEPQANVPFIRLEVAIDTPVLDSGETEAIWIAQPADHKHTNGRTLGQITSLRICYKPNSGSKIIDLVGRKSTKELLPGESCLLFIKLQIPRLRPARSAHADEDIDQTSLFDEIQSMVGTLEQDVLHVEARYKHSLVHAENTVTCRTVCKIRRPKADSRWSICSSRAEHATHPNVHERLANYISAHCLPQQALDLISYHLGASASNEHAVRLVCEALETQLRAQSSRSLDTAPDKPSILISDTSLETDSSGASPSVSEKCSSTASASPLSRRETRSHSSARSLLSASLPSTNPQTLPSAPPSRNPSPTPAHPTNTTPKAPAPLLPTSPTPPTHPPTAPDSARTVWKHIRQSSLTHFQHLVDSAPETLERLEASDEVIRELRRKALANKRSVGAETLRAWKWDERRGDGGGVGAPWM
ncbi:hypothetical protein Q7P37_005596 [Cladosporium fusiforme]